MRSPGTLALLALPLAVVTAPALAGGWEIDRDASVFAVVTGKAGLAKGLAHEHLVTAHGYQVELAFDGAEPADVRFSFETETASLVIDDADEKAALGEALREAGVTTEPFAAVSPKDQAKIRASMLAADQLDSVKHPKITATLSGLAPVGNAPSPVQGELALTVVGKTVTKPIRADWEEKDGTLTLHAHGTFRFTDFGIEPYSAGLGTVRVADGFHVWVRLVARQR